MKVFDWIARIAAAAILLQTLYFKLLGFDESVFIFTELGVEPWGRIATRIFEFIAAVLLLTPRTVWIGCVLTVGLMVGAILSHLFVLGIEIQNDGGLLFALAVIVAICGTVSFFCHRSDIPFLIKSARIKRVRETD